MADSEQLRNAENLLTSAIVGQGELLDAREIPQIVRQFWSILSGNLYNLQELDFDPFVRALETRFVTTMGKGVALIDDEIPHNEEWYVDRPIEWNYWGDYKNYLTSDAWSPRVIQSLDSVTNTIVGLLQEPLQDGDWERRGLVIGDVQSGKTANYLGLITKAADAGYKFIIVITGIHNALRTQTQERIDQGFIGRNSTTQQYVGVGKIRPSRAMPVTVTTAESDFNSSVARRFTMELNSLNNTFILVIKKNVSTLTSLYTWLRELNTRKEFEKISNIPMLMIDDEADNASINTNKPDLDPTRTNREIRNILNLFRKRCYVGYTATPFANIFIDPDDKDEKLGTNLFPAHFIYSLDAPTNYFGYEKIFLDEAGRKQYIIKIDDAEKWIPLGHKKDAPIYELPATLEEAIRLFVLCRAIRNLRNQGTKHCSMLVNVSRFVAAQREVRSLVDIYLGNLQKAIRYNYALGWDKANSDTVIAQLYEDFHKHYSESGNKWEDVLQELNSAADAVKVVVVNSRSDEKLLYSEYNRDNEPYTVIAIGGLSLSRGLTLEGLTISYIYRNTKMYDTLMQMGRWFGYRDGYGDLCRIYMSDLSYEWYAYIADATEELRLQIKRMRRERKKPSDFGLYVKAHPDTLIVTALNKMYYTESRTFRISYDGKLIETYVLPEDAAKNQENMQLLTDFFHKLVSVPEDQGDRSPSYLFTDVSWADIQNFIFSFRFHDDIAELKESVARYIKEIADSYPLWDVGFISLQDRKPDDGLMIASQQRTIGYIDDMPRVPVAEPGWYTGNKNRFSGNSMFRIGLSDVQVEQAKAYAAEAEPKRNEPIFRDYTNARAKPILLLHLLNLIDNEKREVRKHMPAISISFPNSNVFKTVDYIVGPVWLKLLNQGQPEAQEDEDDYDFEQPLG